MKKLLLMMAMILPMFITSCSDDEEATVLTGTTWESTEEYASGSYSVDGNNVSLNAEGLIMSGTFSDNVMHLDSGEEGGEFVYYKK